MSMTMASPPPSTVPAGLTGTVVAHGLLIAVLIVGAHGAVRRPPVVYAVNLVAAPLPAPTPRHAAPQATPVAPKEVAPRIKPKPKTLKPPVKPPPPPPPEAKHVDDTPPVTKAPVAPAPTETPSTGQDKATVTQQGLDFPFPEYLRHIENRILANWTRPAGAAGYSAEIRFVIHRDGTVTDIKVGKSSGYAPFDIDAESAVEAAKNAPGFGRLPDGFGPDVLPISFAFTPKKPSQ